MRPTPCADKCADFANSRCDAVVFAYEIRQPTITTKTAWLPRGERFLTADAGGAGLCRQQADVVPGAELPEGQKNTVHHDEAADHPGLGEVEVVAGHDEADDGLQEDSEGQGVPGPEPVRGRGAEHGAGDVEQVDDRVPAKDGGQGRSVPVEVAEDGGRVDAERVGRELRTDASGSLFTSRCKLSNNRTHIIDEPDQADDEEAPAVHLEGQQVGRLGIAHRVLGRGLRLLHEQAEDEEEDRKDHADTQAGAPDGAVVAVVAGRGDYVRDKCCSSVNFTVTAITILGSVVDRPPITNPCFAVSIQESG